MADPKDLATLAVQIAGGDIEVVDLTSPLHADTPILQLPPEYGQTQPFRLRRSAATTTAAPPGTGTTSGLASTPVPIWMPRTTG
jgi:hypothetical protein